MEDEFKGLHQPGRLNELWEQLQNAQEVMMALRSRELEPGPLGYMEMLELLDQPSVAAFAALPEEARSKKWEELFEECDGSFLDDFFLYEVSHFEFLHSFKVLDRHIGHGKMERRLIQEARHFFYQRTEFVFSADWIGKFLADQLGQWDDAVPVEELVRRVIIRVDRRRMDGSKIAQYLRRSLEFTNIESLKVEIWAKGALDGSDYETQDTIRKMAGAVQELIDKFEDRFSIWKMRLEEEEMNGWRDDYIGEPYNITAWWDGPPIESWTRLKQGTASFQELMQDQIKSWKDWHGSDDDAD
ncbi:uncharacterized protein NECHADRAFT_88491 [Fusarium vanettenii 77-13-4]|uniref:Uncharacterized protein n=1 Tax=Fusarium vanettenii (strain ATCC MYA-4622 / CBS 123669 / FGSC 9596 / NRRL 45880 / 77-13-4) TaxID=660122 RepID=C7ZBQ3_FUSV7|nr:uncharacterized protein NECHADRAFT_88491 [Fusarium vanettenii 77-13-4]EEU38557.1 predicted protein [Fusarium vanettenii 77-13-4]